MTFDAADLRFLREMARDVVEASRVRPGQRVGESVPNSLGHTLIRPGGRDCYPAMWVRDFSMSLDCGLISSQEMLDHLRLIAASQNGSVERRLFSGAIIPAFAIPDHINFDGSTVFYPGTMSAGEDQGGEPFGVLPPADDHYELIHIARHVFKTHPQVVTAMSDALIRAFNAVEVNASTGGMVSTSPARRAVGFGFCDTVYLTGSLLFPSLLRWRAANELAAMFPDRGDEYSKSAAGIASHIVAIFGDVPRIGGWLYAATDIGRQPDVWGTLFALHLGVLPAEFAIRARRTVADAVRNGEIVYRAAVRHVPATFDASPSSAWSRVAPGIPINTYQNGAYWHTPTGWLIAALHRDEPQLARDLFREYIAQLRDDDFRKADAFGSPWECFGRDGRARQNPVYMTSVTLPLAVIEKLAGES
jgi:hypothetical protein